MKLKVCRYAVKTTEENRVYYIFILMFLLFLKSEKAPALYFCC